MDRVQVTPQMHERILNNIEQADLTASAAAPIRKNTAAGRRSFSGLRRFTALAACLAIMLAGGLALPDYLPGSDTDTSAPPSVTSPVNEAAEAASRMDLEKAVGFSVPGLNAVSLPFNVQKTVYTAYGKDMAEVTYLGTDHQAVYRKGKGSDDVSGDYNDYSSQKKITVSDVTVILKGSGDGYCLAVWQDEDYSYSASLDQDAPASTWRSILKAQ